MGNCLSGVQWDGGKILAVLWPRVGLMPCQGSARVAAAPKVVNNVGSPTLLPWVWLLLTDRLVVLVVGLPVSAF